MEILFVLAAFAAVASVALVPWLLLLEIGAALAALGLGVGVPAGLLYHVQLRRELRRGGGLPPRWWISPLAHHARLEEDALRRVLPACHVGAGGAAVAAVGCAVTFLGVLGSFGLGPTP